MQSEIHRVYIMAGQSNMAGDSLPADLPRRLLYQSPRLHYYNTTRDPPATSILTQEKFGPEASMYPIVLRYGKSRQLYIVKYAKGASPIVDWQKGEVNYIALMAAIDGAGLPENVIYTGVIWLQGENDSRTDNEAGALGYKPNLEALVADLRSDLSSPNMRIYIIRVNPPEAGYSHASIVRQAQEEVADEDSFGRWINTDDLTKFEDDIHYDDQGQLRLGRRLAHTILQFRLA